MKKSIISAMLLAIIILLSASSIFAQDKPKQTLWYVTEYVVKPTKIAEYRSLMKDFVNHCAENEYEYTWYQWSDYNLHYISSMLVKDYNTINLINEKMGPVVKSWGKENVQKWYETLEYKKSYFVRVSSDYQYFPKNPRLKSGEGKYAIWDVYHVIPGKVEEFGQILKQFIALLKANNYPNRIDFMRDDVGMEDPQFIGLVYAKNRIDFWEENKKMWDMLGKEGQALYADILKLTKRREFKEFWYHRGLSYTPKKK